MNVSGELVHLYRQPRRCAYCGLDVMDGQVRIGFWLKPEGDVVVHAVCARGMTPPEVAEDIYRRGLSAEPSRSPPRIARDGTRVAEEANSQSVNEGSIPSGRTL